jgi:hypothetical protein
MPLSFAQKKAAQRSARLRRAYGRASETVFDGFRKPSLLSSEREK